MVQTFSTTQLGGEESLLPPSWPLKTRNHRPGPEPFHTVLQNGAVALKTQTDGHPRPSIPDTPVLRQVLPHSIGHTQVQVGQAAEELLIPTKYLGGQHGTLGRAETPPQPPYDLMPLDSGELQSQGPLSLTERAMSSL